MNKIEIRNAKPSEFDEVGKIMVEVYSNLEGFPTAKEQPEYYNMLKNIGEQTQKPSTELLVALVDGIVAGGVVYFDNMKYYGSGGSATQEKNASGFRLLAVSSKFRGLKLGKKLSQKCIKKAIENGNEKMVIHTTKSMELAWGMYERLGFKRAKDLDFMQRKLPVYGFRLKLSEYDN